MRAFGYVAAESVDEAVRAISDAPGRGRFLAGGTTLVDLMRLGVMNADQLVDITSIGDLHEVETSEGPDLVFGALAKMSDVAEDPALVREYPALSEALGKAASQQLRNMATVGGNLLQRTRCEYFRGVGYPCNKRDPGSGCAALDGINRGHALLGGSESCIATYAGDFAVALAAFDAVVELASPRGRRSLPMIELHREPGSTPDVETVLEPDEMIVRIRVPRTSVGRASTYHKIRDRESFAFATVSCAVALAFDGDKVSDARISLGGVATKPWRATLAEQSLIGSPLTPESAERAGVLAFDGAQPRDANRFKLRLGPRTVAQALAFAKARP